MKHGRIFAIVLLLPFTSLLAQKDCNLPSRGWTPLPEMGNTKFNGYPGGLYAGSKNTPSGQYLKDAMDLAKTIVPLDTAGNPSPNGSIVLAGVGASNPRTEFEAFTSIAAGSGNTNARLRMLNTCIGGQGVQKMNVATDNYWKSAFKMLDSMQLSAKQVQVAWIETDNTGSKDTNFPSAPLALVGDLKLLLQTLKIKFPNLKLCYLSARAYSGWAPPNGSGVGGGLLAPRDYYNGWAIKWLIDSAALGAKGLEYKGATVSVPMPLYGSYNWTNAGQTRKDGFSLDCNTDVGSDGLHLTAAGEQKIGQNIYNTFAADTTAKLWFLKSNTSQVNSTETAQFNIYPNPVNNQLNIELNNPKNDEYLIQIFDTKGQLVFTKVFTRAVTVIDLQNYKPGLYRLKILEKGSTTSHSIVKTEQ